MVRGVEYVSVVIDHAPCSHNRINVIRHYICHSFLTKQGQPQKSRMKIAEIAKI